MLNAVQPTITPGQVVQYGDGWKAFVLAPAHFAGFWQIENVYDDAGLFAIVAERDLRPAELDEDELYICGLESDWPEGLDINLVKRSY
ncbi:hypothetical protein [Mesorhizobium sp. f-mel]